MRTRATLSLAAPLAALLLCAALSTASARNLSIGSQTLRATWSRFEFAISSITVRCQVTLEGSFHSRTVAKVARTLIGAITRVNINEGACTGGQIRSSRPPPWHVTYEGFTGTLPAITSVLVLLSRFLLEIDLRPELPVVCKYGKATDNTVWSMNLDVAEEVTTLTPTAGAQVLNLLEGNTLICPPTGALITGATDGVVRALNTTNKIRVALI